MPVTKILARDYVFELNIGSEQVPDWVEIKGVTSWSHSPAKGEADTTSFDENGRQSHLPASRGDEFTLNGFVLEDESTGDRDPGQAAVEQWADEIGPSGLKQFRITSPSGFMRSFLASATVTAGGGGNDDASTWEVTIKTSGAITRASAVVAPGAPSSVAGTTDDGFSIITWTDSATGAPFDRYEVRALVGSNVVDTIAVTTPEVAYFPLTNGVTYTFQVRARNARGWSDWSTASSAITPSS